MWLSVHAPSKRNQSLDGIRAFAVILTFNVHFFGGYLATFRGANPNRIPLTDFASLFDKTLYWLFYSHSILSFVAAVALALISYQIAERFYFSTAASAVKASPSSTLLAPDPAQIVSGKIE
jgi:peptidoglycan/LPS O-acetylase OafA/YrhL